jgi:hypothetical protein
VRALDRFLLALRAPGARSRGAYRVLVAIAALERAQPKQARVATEAIVRRPRGR